MDRTQEIADSKDRVKESDTREGIREIVARTLADVL
jgi:hypothetical protein